MISQVFEGRERLREIETEEYRTKIREGTESPSLPAEDVFTRLKGKYQAMIDSQA